MRSAPTPLSDLVENLDEQNVMHYLAIVANEKRPLTQHGVKDATNDVEALRYLAQQHPHANVGIALEYSGLCAIDVDGPEGEDAFAALELKHALLPTTRTHKTPRGRHYILAGSLPPTVGRLGPKIDTRGRDSYIVAPPSVIEGTPYRVENDVPIAALPQWIADLLEAPRAAPQISVAHGIPFTPEQLTAMLSHLDPDCSRDEWRDIAAALHASACTDPDFDKRALFVRWSRGEVRHV